MTMTATVAAAAAGKEETKEDSPSLDNTSLSLDSPAAVKGAESGFNTPTQAQVSTATATTELDTASVERSDTRIESQTEFLTQETKPITTTTTNTTNTETNTTQKKVTQVTQVTLFSTEDLKENSMATRKNFEEQRSTPPSFSAPFPTFGLQLPTPQETPSSYSATPFHAPQRRSATPFVNKSEMTPSPSPESSGDEDEEVVELELSVGRLGLNKRGRNGGNSPANERVDSEEVQAPVVEVKSASEARAYRLSAEDLAVLERAAAILRGQVRHFEEEITANINQQIRELYKDSLDPPDIADMDSMPDFHVRNNPYAPNAIVKSVQVCCAVERGLAAILEVQRASEERMTEKSRGGSTKREESLMEICVKRPVATGAEMQSAVKGIAKTVGYGGREKRGSSVEWRV